VEKNFNKMIRPLTKLVEILKDYGVENQPLAEKLESWIIARDEIESDQLDELTAQVKKLKEKQANLKSKKQLQTKNLIRESREATTAAAKMALSEMFDAGLAIVTYMDDGTTYHQAITFGNQYAVECLVENAKEIIYGEEETEDIEDGGTKIADTDDDDE
jgi:hypothetical protein